MNIKRRIFWMATMLVWLTAGWWVLTDAPQTVQAQSGASEIDAERAVDFPADI